MIAVMLNGKRIRETFDTQEEAEVRAEQINDIAYVMVKSADDGALAL